MGGQNSPYGGMGDIGCMGGMGGMGSFQSPFMGRGRSSPMMEGCLPPGYSSPFGMDMGLRVGGLGMGSGMGMGPGMGMGMSMGSPLGCMGYPGRSPFLSGSPMGYQNPSPFGFGSPHSSPSMLSGGYRHREQSSFSRFRRSPFSISPYDDEDEDESDYDTSSLYTSPRRRRDPFRYLGRSPYRNQGRPNWMYGGYNSGYNDYNDDDDDDESDLEDYYPRRRLPRY